MAVWLQLCNLIVTVCLKQISAVLWLLVWFFKSCLSVCAMHSQRPCRSLSALPKLLPVRASNRQRCLLSAPLAIHTAHHPRSSTSVLLLHSLSAAQYAQCDNCNCLQLTLSYVFTWIINFLIKWLFLSLADNNTIAVYFFRSYDL